jgi:hypothetical protein
MTIIGFIVTGIIDSPTLERGDPYRLLNAIDYTGRICGYEGNVTNSPYGYYLPDKTAVCVTNCPTEADYTKYFCKYYVQEEVDADTTGLRGLYYISQSECMYYIKSTVCKLMQQKDFKECKTSTLILTLYLAVVLYLNNYERSYLYFSRSLLFLNLIFILILISITHHSFLLHSVKSLCS